MRPEIPLSFHSMARTVWTGLRDTFRAMVGVPNYEVYLAHHKLKHPDRVAMNYEEFFRDSQIRRYEGSKGGKCC